MENAIQHELFQALKSKIPAGQSAADEIAKILEISPDSAYRRMRGEKPLTIDELHKLCMHYKISLDHLMNLQTDAFLFQGRLLNHQTFRFDEYLKNVLQVMNMMISFSERQFFYLCKDIPFFHHYHLREIAAFKYYFWMRTILQMPDFANKKVSLKAYPQEFFEMGSKSLHIYNQLEGYELWNLESLNSTIRQIDFYSDSQLFESSEDAYMVYDAMEKLVLHLQKQAELGYKFTYGDEKMTPMGKFHVYFNEVLLLDNSMLAILNNIKISYMVHSGMNFMISRDINFCENMHNYILNLIRKSTLLSVVNEKERLRFFNRLKEKLAHRKQSLRRS